MDKKDTKTEERIEEPDAVASETQGAATPPDPSVELAALTDKWKRALADAENARKRADVARMEGREYGVAIGVDALAPVYDAVCFAIEVAHASPDADTPQLAAYLEGLDNIKTAFETGLKALGVRAIAPKNAPFDPALHEAMQIEETDETKAGEVLVLHRPGFAIGQRLIRPAHVTVSARPSKPKED